MFRRYRMLILVYAIVLVVGGREYMVRRSGNAAADWPGGCKASAAACSSTPSGAAPVDDSTFWRQHAELTRVVAEVNPGDPDTDFLLGMQALADGDVEEFERRTEAALASGVKHNDILMHAYAQFELDRGADWQRINLAINRWRENHPFSAETIALQLGTGPADQAEEALLHQALAGVRWVAGSSLERIGEGADARWRVQLSFRPGRTVDIREAVAAITVLSLTPEQRSRFEVTCSTLVDCTLVPRS